MPLELAKSTVKNAKAARALSVASNPRNTFTLNMESWLGFAPDLPDHIFGARAWVEGSIGLRPKRQPDGGVALTIDAGFKQVDSGNLPLDTASTPDGQVACMQSLLRTNTTGFQTGEYVLALMVVTGATDGAGKMYRLIAAGTWAEVSYEAHASYTGATALAAAIDGNSAEGASMGFSAAFAAGSGSHSPLASVGS